MKCQKCGQETFLPFRCPYCEGYFCPDHRLPENHGCQKMGLARLPKEEMRPLIVGKQKKHTYTVTYSMGQSIRLRRFSRKEIKHLTTAALLVFGVGSSSVIFHAELGNPFMLAMLALAFAASFLAHEIAHKLVAQKEGLWAEFRLTIFGAVLTLLSIFSIFKIISPSAVMIAGLGNKDSVGKISIAGPATNIVLAVLFLSLTFPFQNLILEYLAFINAFIALFNLIPFGMLDGFKIFLWSKKVWVSAFTVSLVLTLIFI